MAGPARLVDSDQGEVHGLMCVLTAVFAVEALGVRCAVRLCGEAAHVGSTLGATSLEQERQLT